MWSLVAACLCRNAARRCVIRPDNKEALKSDRLQKRNPFELIVGKVSWGEFPRILVASEKQDQLVPIVSASS